VCGCPAFEVFCSRPHPSLALDQQGILGDGEIHATAVMHDKALGCPELQP
jgi:hypothetical protein